MINYPEGAERYFVIQDRQQTIELLKLFLEKGCRCLVRISDLKSGMLLYKCLLDYFDLIKAKEKSGAMDIYKMALSDFAEFSKDKIETIKEQSAKWLDFMTETYEDMPEIVVWEGLESGVDEI